ncbi:uncharacterized protein LOC115751273 [Rhodamnia argentea]|uniref:Uncharacterized protein LOC115751273 n=1 Tax=Rhodamnia argentea TaxID=178133 RepID=A0A8B8QCR5_9MYRT|nr:uncharacterized protein LOC115751273 [Rhodamnia argentea]
MSGHLRFESASAGTDELAIAGGHLNGNRASHSRSSLDRSGSFRESCENRMFSTLTSLSGENSTSNGDVPPISDCLMLDPITLGDQKYQRLGELRRILGIPFGSTAEDSSSGAGVAKLPHPAAVEELKRFKSSVWDTSSKARRRAKKLEESLYKLNKYNHVLNSKKPQRNGTTANERSGGSNLSKMASQNHRNSSELLSQGLEDRSKSVVLNKRVRSSMAELRTDSQGHTLTKLPAVTGKDREMTRNVVEGSDLVEDKNHRLPAGGEGWDKKMKRKRSIGSGFSRPLLMDGETKRPVFHKVKTEPSLQSSDAQGSRLSVREETSTASPSQTPKAKGSRAPRSGSVVAATSPTNFSRSSGAFEACEQSPSASKVHMIGGPTNNRKRPLPSESSSPPMAQWVCHRQKTSRNRRANIVSPVSNHNESNPPSEGCALDPGLKMSSVETSAPLFSRGFANGIQQLKVKLENVSSPARLPENDESGGGQNRESRMKEKRASAVEVDEIDVGTIRGVSSSIVLPKKNKTVPKDDVGDGVQRQGRSGRCSSFPRANIASANEKMDNAASKPLRSAKPGSEKNGSKTGRPPLKKVSDRKAFARHAKSPAGSTPDISGASDDDREELLEAAKFASRANGLVHSGVFWKKMESFFSPVSLEDISYLKQQRDLVHEESMKPHKHVFGERDNGIQCQYGSGESAASDNVTQQVEDKDVICGKLNPGGMKVLPLYQRLLASLIIEEEAIFEEGGEGRSLPFSHNEDGNSGANCLAVGVKSRNGDGSVHENDVMHELQTPMQYNIPNYSGNGSINKSIQSDLDLMHKGQVLCEISKNGFHGSVAAFSCVAGISYDEQYMHMSIESKLLVELHSVDLYPESVPDLVNGEDEAINNDISDLKKQLSKQVGEKKLLLDKLLKAIPEGSADNGRDLERTAMQRLVEMAYRKQLATRASIASRNGIPKVPKHVAMAFTRRTLARCKEFEDTGKSCFSEPSLSEVLFAAPPRGCEESIRHDNLCSSPVPGTSGSSSKLKQFGLQNDDIGLGPNDNNRTLLHPPDQAFGKTGPIWNRGKKKELLLDDVGAMRVASSPAKGKRSERDRDPEMVLNYSAAKGGRQNSVSAKGERKAKSKPKQRTAQLSSSGNGYISKFSEMMHPVSSSAHESKKVLAISADKKQELDKTNGNAPPGLKGTNESEDLANLDLLGDLDVPSWLNFEGDALQDHDSMGLEIPMDDLSDVFL